MTAKELYDEICNQFGGFWVGQIPDDATGFQLEFVEGAEDQINEIYNKYNDNPEVAMEVAARWIERPNGLLIYDYNVDYDMDKEEPVIDIMNYDGVCDSQHFIHIITEPDEYKEEALALLDSLKEDLHDEDDWIDEYYNEYKARIEKNDKYIRDKVMPGHVVVVYNDPIDAEYKVEIAPRYSTRYDYCGISSRMTMYFSVK